MDNTPPWEVYIVENIFLYIYIYIFYLYKRLFTVYSHCVNRAMADRVIASVGDLTSHSLQMYILFIENRPIYVEFIG